MSNNNNNNIGSNIIEMNTSNDEYDYYDVINECHLLNSISNEQLQFIFSFLSPKSLAVCQSVCKIFYKDIDHTAFHIIDLLREKYTWLKRLFDEDNMLLYKQRKPCQLLQFLITKQILLVGGNSEPHRVDGYDIELKEWKNWCNTDIGREVFFEVLWFHGYVYVFCGIHHSSYGSVERFNIVTNNWSKGPPLPGKLAAVVGTNLNDQLYIIGGYDFHTTEYSDAMFFLDLEQNKWIEHDARLRAGRSSHAAVTYQNKIWVAGGILDDQYCEGNETVEIFDPNVGYWVSGPALNQRRFRLRLFVVNDELYAVGGDRDERGRLVVQTIDKLDKDNVTWVYVTSFRQERRGFLSSVVGSKIFVIGGRSGDVPLHTWDYYDVTTGIWLSEGINDNCYGVNDLDHARQDDFAALLTHGILEIHGEEHEYKTKGTRFLNRREGVVGGRAVTFPEIDITW